MTSVCGNFKTVALLLFCFKDRELMNAKERLEMETSTQRSTVENQLQRIGMLENALTNTQVNANRCDEEVTTFSLRSLLGGFLAGLVTESNFFRRSFAHFRKGLFCLSCYCEYYQRMTLSF